ncbi:MAG: Acetylornithine aminotransferase [Alphaproteobacteria bacterium MarineAlpha5_Bin9]|nr:MAG: Acetylornithine aminotransferase [Alphaproteobacteria bacterium MarineAlpha5_Bin9]|tara:strand:- start:4041 stop:5219 length:1179 start_codon:yes stop_codon:yes gene_type:complete
MNENNKSYIMSTYGERTLEFISGDGVYLLSKENKKYLDFGSGIAVNSLGHCHPALISALNKQSKILWHTSNLYKSEAQENYAKKLCQNSFADKVFFTNSGVESVECGIKVIKSYFYHTNKKHKKNIITFEGAFHGRSLGALSTQKKKKYIEGFEPLLEGFIQVPFNDLYSLEKVIDEKTAAIMIETIQGEGGIKVAPFEFIEKIKNICLKKELLFFLDEVQCGFGRTGKLFAYQWSNIEPDIMALAKGIGSGFPLGACLATSKACIGMKKGSHGSTYGGNPLAISIGNAVIDEILKEGFLDNITNLSNYFFENLNLLKQKHDEIQEIRGLGLLLGIKTKSNNLEINKLFENKGLLSVPASDNVVRFAPPLIINKDHIDEAITKISEALSEKK